MLCEIALKLSNMPVYELLTFKLQSRRLFNCLRKRAKMPDYEIF